MRPQLQLPGRDGKAGGLGPLHQLYRQVGRRADLGLQRRVSRHRLQELPQGRALHGLSPVAARWRFTSVITHSQYNLVSKLDQLKICHRTYAGHACPGLLGGTDPMAVVLRSA